MAEMKVTTHHMVGDYKYIIGHNNLGEEFAIRVYLKEAQIIVKPKYDDELGHCLSVSARYKANDRYGRSVYYIYEKDIYDTKEDAKRVIEYRKQNKL